MKPITINWDHNNRIVWILSRNTKKDRTIRPINFYKNGVLYDRLPFKDAERIFIKAKLYAYKVKGSL